MTGDFVNCDWGTTHFRLRAARAEGREILAEFSSEEGAAHLADLIDQRLAGERFRDALQHGLAQLHERLAPGVRTGPVIISGMASSSIGWQELPYAPLPLALDGTDLVWRELEPLDGPHGPQRIVLVSGARSGDDVMRGEETQALGVFQLSTAANLSEAALLIMPGTHSKHLQVKSRRIHAFQTFMTGELFEVLGRHSILQHSLGSDVHLSEPEGDALAAFQEGVEHSRKVGLSAALFRVRTRQLLDKLPPLANRAFLSGVLIGSELAYLQGAETSDRPILLCAAAPLDALYDAALDALGLRQRLTVVPPADVERLSALGQAILLRKLHEV